MPFISYPPENHAGKSACAGMAARLFWRQIVYFGPRAHSKDARASCLSVSLPVLLLRCWILLRRQTLKICEGACPHDEPGSAFRSRFLVNKRLDLGCEIVRCRGKYSSVPIRARAAEIRI